MSAPHASALLERLSVVEVAGGETPEAPAAFHGRLRDRRLRGDELVELVELAIAGRTGELAVLDVTPAGLAPEGLLGASAYRGFRRRLDVLATGDAEELALRRLLWDLPLTIMIGMQPRIIEHPLVPVRAAMPNPPPGVDQCAGWVAGGQMLQLIEATDGRLRMTPSPVLVGGDHLGDPEPTVLPPFSTRRRRRLRVGLEDGVLVISDVHRDSFADPEGVERVLHNWIVSATADPDDLVIESVEVSSGALPWVECPTAAGSGGRLVGRRFDELEALITTEFTGITTCTHLNDTLLTMAAVPELLAHSLD